MHDRQNAGHRQRMRGEPGLERLELVHRIDPAVEKDEDMGRLGGRRVGDQQLQLAVPCHARGAARADLLVLRADGFAGGQINVGALLDRIEAVGDEVGQHLAAPGTGRAENHVDKLAEIGGDVGHRERG